MKHRQKQTQKWDKKTNRRNKVRHIKVGKDLISIGNGYLSMTSDRIVMKAYRSLFFDFQDSQFDFNKFFSFSQVQDLINDFQGTVRTHIKHKTQNYSKIFKIKNILLIVYIKIFLNI